MNEEHDSKTFRMGAWKAIVFAIVLLVVGELFLAWQYNRLEKRATPHYRGKTGTAAAGHGAAGCERHAERFSECPSRRE